MKQLLCLFLISSLTGCATIHRHPVLTGFVVTSAFASGIAAGVVATRPNEPKVQTQTIVIPVHSNPTFCIVGTSGC